MTLRDSIGMRRRKIDHIEHFGRFRRCPSVTSYQNPLEKLSASRTGARLESHLFTVGKCFCGVGT